MNLYIYIVLITVLFLNIMSTGIVMAKLGDEKKGNYEFSDIFFHVLFTAFVAVAASMATKIYFGGS